MLSRPRGSSPFLVFAFALFVMSPTALAVPGPATTVIIANATVPESMALAERYRRARNVPAAQLCPVEVADAHTISLPDFRAQILEPVMTCLRDGGALERIEAAVLMRGLPIRVGTIPDGINRRRVSLAAALGTWRSTNEDGTPFLGAAPGRVGTCGSAGSPCYRAYWQNSFRGGTFEPGWTNTRMGVTWRPILVTMLHGRSYEEAESLLQSALDAERGSGPPEGEVLFMQGRNSARSVLDGEFPEVVEFLATRGQTARIAPFNSNLIGQTLRGFAVGADQIGDTIEGNTYLPGAIVDNLTSFGAVPQNFEASGESQVSIARWVRAGVAGVHGTTDEPISNSFPSRLLFVDYFSGSTLAEAYLRRMPFMYWHNLVLGDPMAAPYAARPVVVIAAETLAPDSSSTSFVITATDPRERGIARLVAYADGIEVAAVEGDRLEFCYHVATSPEQTSFLFVAQAAYDEEGPYVHRPKGWLPLGQGGSGGRNLCAGDPPDSGAGDGGMPDAAAPMLPDAALDATPGPPPPTAPTGCGCQTLAPTPAALPAILWLLGLWALRRRA